MAEDNPEFEQLVEAQRLCQLMRSDDKYLRKFALINFENLVRHESSLSDAQYHEIFIACYTILFNTLRDRNEIVREVSIKCISEFLMKVLPSNDFYLSHLLPVIIERTGTAEVVEESEEIRLLLIQLIYEIIDCYNEHHLVPSMNDFITVLQQSVKDKFAPVKEVSCNCIIQLARCMPKHFHMQAQSLVQPVLTVLKHQHQKVRIVGIKCIVEVIMHSPYQALIDSLVPLAERLFDLGPNVRTAVMQVGAKLLMSYRDRYSFFHKILPILLTGLHDELPSVRDEAQELWDKVGLQYQKENEMDLKDQLDFLTLTPKHYPANVGKRPNLGCRMLIQRNVCKLADPICSELLCWQDGVRLRCAQLLCVIALHAEEAIIQHLPQLINTMCISARDTNSSVHIFVVQAAELIGAFVPVDAWLKLMLPAIEGGYKSGHFKILAALIRSAPQDLIAPVLNEIVEIISDVSVTHVRMKAMQQELVGCIHAIESKHRPGLPVQLNQNLFNMIITLVSNSQDADTINDHLLEELRLTLSLPTQYSLWDRFLPKLLEQIKVNPRGWGVHTFEKGIFQYILLNSRIAFGENLTEIGEILIECLHEDVEPESRLSTFVVLSTALEKKEIIFGHADTTDEFFKMLVTAISPALVWKAGRTAEALRTVAVACVASAFTCKKDTRIFRHKPTLESLADIILPLLYSLCEDTSDRTRLLSLECIQLIKYHLVTQDVWTVEQLNICYPHVMRRLDDPIDKVRFMAAKLLLIVLEKPPEGFLSPVYRTHLNFIVDSLFIHHDDSDEGFRDLIRAVLLMLGRLNPHLVLDGAEKNRPVVHNQAGCDEIMQYLENMQADPAYIHATQEYLFQ